MRGRLKIVRLKTAVVEGNFDWTFVRIETDEGIQGLGECFFAPGLTSILRSLEPVILGEDCRDVRRLFRKLQRSEEHTSELQSQSNLVCRLLLEKKKKYTK